MAVAQSRTVDVKFGARKRPEFNDFVLSLGQEASRLTQPVQLLGAISLCIALLAWLLLFYSYSFDSFKSLVLCLGFFAFVLTPGFVFLWLGASLRRLARLPRLLPRMSGAQPPASASIVKIEAAQATEATEGAEPTGPAKWFRMVKARVDNVLVLWEYLSFSKNEFRELTGPSRSMAFLAHPACAFLVAAAFVINVFISLGCIVALLAGVLSRIF